MIRTNLKRAVVLKIQDLLQLKTTESKLALEAVQESRNTATKSTAGDKHETSRAMMQNELDLQRSLMNKNIQRQNELGQLDLSKKYMKVELGSMVYTNQGLYFIAISYGKIDIEGEECYVISPISPFGQVLLNKNTGDEVFFRNNKIKIYEIV